jgi:hypothetical protein
MSAVFDLLNKTSATLVLSELFASTVIGPHQSKALLPIEVTEAGMEIEQFEHSEKE